MTEREKAAAGLLYDANYDEELIREREACKYLCFRLNSCLPSDTRSQKEILKKLIPGIPDSAVVTAPFWCDYGRNITVGEGFYTNHNCIILDGAKVTFGDYVFIPQLLLLHRRPSAGRRTAERRPGNRPSHHRGEQCLDRSQCHRSSRRHHR